MERHQIRERLEAIGIIPIIRTSSTELAARAAHAVVAAGIDVVEITMNVPDAISLLGRLRSEIGEQCPARRRHGPRCCHRAGLYRRRRAVHRSPRLRRRGSRGSAHVGPALHPRSLDPTEVILAWRAGADLVRMFPCSALGGPSYLRQLRGPLPNVSSLSRAAWICHRSRLPCRRRLSARRGWKGAGHGFMESEGLAAMLSRCAQLRDIVITAQTGNRVSS